MAYAYVVTGSEDGILGVYRNLKVAKKIAQEYTRTEVPEDVLNNDFRGDFVWMYRSTEGWGSAEVEKFELVG